MLGVSKQAFHKQKNTSTTRKLAKESFALEYIHNIRKKDPGIGGMKLWYMYKRNFPENDRLGRDCFEDIIHRYGLKVRNKTRKPKTTDSSHGLKLYPNLIYDYIPLAINQLWVCDITYIQIWLNNKTYSFAYLSIVMDAYSHEIIGWAIGPTLETQYPIIALNMALKRIKKDEIKTLIHHSDRGIQYASNEYVNLLQKYHIKISMTENGDPKENAMAERVNSTIKNELLKGLQFHCIKEVEDALTIAIDFYNKSRPHMSIDMMTPQEAAQYNGIIHKWWRSYREDAIKSNNKRINNDVNNISLSTESGFLPTYGLQSTTLSDNI